jgi:thiol-disulfide isomerase/thioredoxin
VGRTTNKQRRQQQAVTARDKAALARAQQQRVAQRRRALAILSTIVVIAVVAGVGAFLVINHKGSNARDLASLSLVNDVHGVSAATISAVGAGSDTLVPKKVGDPALTSGGKPEVLFIGAEFCPFCAAERWPLVQALMRFGTFKNLGTIDSSSTDVDPSTPTFTFYKSSYTSKYLSFVPVEDENRSQDSLENPSAAEQKLWVKYTGNPPGFPFIDFGGKYIQTSQSYDPSILSGLTQAQVAAALNNPSSAIAKAIVGGANMTTATICKLTNNQPSSVCATPTITGIESKLSG